MSDGKPDDIPQDVWDLAQKVFDENNWTDEKEWCARAIIADRNDLKTRINIVLDTAMDKVTDQVWNTIIAVAAEREACAMVAETMPAEHGPVIAKAIRARQ